MAEKSLSYSLKVRLTAHGGREKEGQEHQKDTARSSGHFDTDSWATPVPGEEVQLCPVGL